MALDTKLKSGTDYLPVYNWAYGMNDDLAYADRASYNTSVEMVTTGSPHDWDDFSSLEVAPTMYEHDPMGVERDLMTFTESIPRAKNHIGKLATESSGMQAGVVSTVGGKPMNLAPQNYNSVGLNKKS